MAKLYRELQPYLLNLLFFVFVVFLCSLFLSKSLLADPTSDSPATISNFSRTPARVLDVAAIRAEQKFIFNLFKKETGEDESEETSFEDLVLAGNPKAVHEFLRHALVNDDKNSAIAAESAHRLFEKIAALKESIKKEEENLSDAEIEEILIAEYISRDLVHERHPDINSKGEVNVLVTPLRAKEGLFMRIAIDEETQNPVVHIFVGVDSPCVKACSLDEVLGGRYSSFKEVLGADIFSQRFESYLGGQVLKRRAVIHIMGTNNAEFKTIEIDRNGMWQKNFVAGFLKAYSVHVLGPKADRRSFRELIREEYFAGVLQVGMIGLFSFILSDLPQLMGYEESLQEIGSLERITKPVHTFMTAMIYSAFLPVLVRWFRVNSKSMLAKEYIVGLTLGSIFFLMTNEITSFLTGLPVEARMSLFSAVAYAKLGPQKFYTTALRFPSRQIYVTLDSMRMSLTTGVVEPSKNRFLKLFGAGATIKKGKVIQALFYLIPQALSQMGQISSSGRLVYNFSTGVWWDSVQEKDMTFLEYAVPFYYLSLPMQLFGGFALVSGSIYLGFDQGLLLYMKRRLTKIKDGLVEPREDESETALMQRISLLENKINASRAARKKWLTTKLKSVMLAPKILCTNAFARVNEGVLYPLSQIPF